MISIPVEALYSASVVVIIINFAFCAVCYFLGYGAADSLWLKRIRLERERRRIEKTLRWSSFHV